MISSCVNVGLSVLLIEVNDKPIYYAEGIYNVLV